MLCLLCPLYWALSFDEGDLWTLEAYEFMFYSALLLVVKSILLTLRHKIVCFPCCGCPHFGEADFVDLEVLNYFLQCSPCSGINFGPRGTNSFFTVRFPWWSRSFGPRGTNLFLTVHFLWWSRSFGPRGTNLFLTVDQSLTSRLRAF